MSRKVISKKKKENAAGVTFALITDGVTWEVWVLRENYNGKVRGGMSKTWRYVERGMLEDSARKLFDRRTK